MSDAYLKIQQMSLNCQNDCKIHYLHVTAFKKKFETLKLLSNLLDARGMLHPMPNVEARETVILFRDVFSMKYLVMITFIMTSCTSFVT